MSYFRPLVVTLLLVLSAIVTACIPVDLSGKRCDIEGRCAEGWQCRAGLCLRACTIAADCDVEEQCQQGLCTPPGADAGDPLDAGLPLRDGGQNIPSDGGDATDAGPHDGGPPDSGLLDSGLLDSGTGHDRDAGPGEPGLDAGIDLDAGLGNADAGKPSIDGGLDAGMDIDAGPATPDAGPGAPDAGPASLTITCPILPRSLPCATGCCPIVTNTAIPLTAGDLADSPAFDFSVDGTGNIWLYYETPDGSVVRTRLDADAGSWSSTVSHNPAGANNVLRIDLAAEGASGTPGWVAVLTRVAAGNTLSLTSPDGTTSIDAVGLLDDMRIVPMLGGGAFVVAIEDGGIALREGAASVGGWLFGSSTALGAQSDIFSATSDGSIVKAGFRLQNNDGLLFDNLQNPPAIAEPNPFLAIFESFAMAMHDGDLHVLANYLGDDDLVSSDPAFGTDGRLLVGELVHVIGGSSGKSALFSYTTFGTDPRVGIVLKRSSDIDWYHAYFTLMNQAAGQGADFRVQMDSQGYLHVISYDPQLDVLRWSSNRTYPFI